MTVTFYEAVNEEVSTQTSKINTKLDDTEIRVSLSSCSWVQPQPIYKLTVNSSIHLTPFTQSLCKHIHIFFHLSSTL